MIRNAASIILLFIILLTAPSLSSALKIDDTTLRVCVLKDSKELDLTIKGYYKMYTLRTNEPLKEGKDLHHANVIPTLSGLVIQDEEFKIYGVKIVPKKDASIYIGKRSFRGNLDIIRTEDKRLLAVNHVNIEDYLKGVLYHEVSHWWPIETLKAQAIAARTYALYQKSVRKDRDYDLTSDIYSQVYGGKISERSKTNRAVNLTRGKALTYKGEIFPTYYHATCGGHTEDASNLWDIDLPSLKGVKCNFCEPSPHYAWRYKVQAAELEKRLKSAGYRINNLKGILPHGKTSSGRVKELKLISDKALIMPAKDFRLITGPNHIRSTNFKITAKGSSFVFNGRGWGHGVGMCQWGAFFLGLKRYKAENILRYYYPGTKIKKL